MLLYLPPDPFVPVLHETPSAQGFLKDCLPALVVSVDCDVMFAVQVVMPFIHAGYDRKTLFLDLSIVSFYVAEGV